MKDTIKKATVKMIQFIGTCGVCGKKIQGLTVGQVEYNLKTHRRTQHK